MQFKFEGIYEQQGYLDFIEKLKCASKYGFVPDGIEQLIKTHGVAIYKAYLSHLKLKNENIASFFSAQKIEAILFQILMKKIYESQNPALEKHSKILRAAEYNITDINALINSGEKSDNWLSVSSSIFDFTHGESWAFFLGGGKSLWGQTAFLKFLGSSIHSEYGSLITNDLLVEMKQLFEEFIKKLPSSILELVVIHDKEHFKETICFTEEHATKPRSPTTYDELLSASEEKIQARVLAPNSVDPNKVKILRFTPDTASDNLNQFKIKVSKLIDKYSLKKQDLTANITARDTHEQEPLVVTIDKKTNTVAPLLESTQQIPVVVKEDTTEVVTKKHDVIDIDQIQEDVFGKAFQAHRVQFDTLIGELEEFSSYCSSSQDSTVLLYQPFVQELKKDFAKIGRNFFADVHNKDKEALTRSFEIFKSSCEHLSQKAEENFKHNIGLWSYLKPILTGFVGVVIAIAATILTLGIATYHVAKNERLRTKYINTFFKSESGSIQDAKNKWAQYAVKQKLFGDETFMNNGLVKEIEETISCIGKELI